MAPIFLEYLYGIHVIYVNVFVWPYTIRKAHSEFARSGEESKNQLISPAVCWAAARWLGLVE